MNKTLTILMIGMFVLALGIGVVESKEEIVKVLQKINLNFDSTKKQSLESQGYQNGNITTSDIICKDEWCYYNLYNGEEKKKTDPFKRKKTICQEAQVDVNVEKIDGTLINITIPIYTNWTDNNTNQTFTNISYRDNSYINYTRYFVIEQHDKTQCSEVEKTNTEIETERDTNIETFLDKEASSNNDNVIVVGEEKEIII